MQDLNTDMSKTAFVSVIIIVVAAILSLSLFAFAYAYAIGDDSQSADDARSGHSAKKASGGGGDDSVDHQDQQQVGKLPDYSKCSGMSSCADRVPDNDHHGDSGSSGGDNILGQNFGDNPNPDDVKREALRIARCAAEFGVHKCIASAAAPALSAATPAIPANTDDQTATTQQQQQQQIQAA